MLILIDVHHSQKVVNHSSSVPLYLVKNLPSKIFDSPPHSTAVWKTLPSGGGGIINFTRQSFLPGEENLRRSDFDDLNLFRIKKQLSVTTEH